jgi:hypothetical protein
MIKLYSQKVLDEIKENYMVGVLATKEDYLPRLGDDGEPVSYSPQMEEIIFYVKPLSQEPKEITTVQMDSPNSSNLYIGFGRKSISNLPSDFKYNTDVHQKIKFIREKLEGKLLLFKPILRQQEQKERFHKNIADIITEEEWIEDKEYLAVPRINLTPEQFESKLISEDTLNLDQYNHAMPAPLYILCGNYIYGNIKENQWRIDSSLNNNGRVILSPNTVKKVEITEQEKQEHIGSERESVVFFDDHYLSVTIADRLDQVGLLINQANTQKTETPREEKDEVMESTEIREVVNTSTNKLDEISFIRDLEKKAKAQRLVYSREDLINFHTSIKSSAFTILSGQSGIGKTKLATLYGETLGLSQSNNTMLIMPISPSYTEPSDILGYYNPSTGLYMPTETGLVEFLIHAQENTTQVHMLIMDEMNLSQIEHYFAPFISLLELEEKERYLNLYSKGSVCHNDQKYKNSIQLKNNLVIVGTMNTDETTKDLSDRLLDRSNVIVLDKKSFLEIKKELGNKESKKEYSTGTEDAYGEVYLTWNSLKENWDAFNEEELEFYDQVDNVISKVDSLKGFSIRNIIRLGAYLNNLPVDSSKEFHLERGKAIDLFIKQRVITKLRGPVELYENLIGTSNSEDQTYHGELYILLDSEEAKCVSTFDKTKKELLRKARELSLHGYAT